MTARGERGKTCLVPPRHAGRDLQRGVLLRRGPAQAERLAQRAPHAAPAAPPPIVWGRLAAACRPLRGACNGWQRRLLRGAVGIATFERPSAGPAPSPQELQACHMRTLAYPCPSSQKQKQAHVCGPLLHEAVPLLAQNVHKVVRRVDKLRAARRRDGHSVGSRAKRNAGPPGGTRRKRDASAPDAQACTATLQASLPVQAAPGGRGSRAPQSTRPPWSTAPASTGAGALVPRLPAAYTGQALLPLPV